MTALRFPLVLVAAFALGNVAWAQKTGTSPETGRTGAQDPNASGDAWYHQQLLDLSEVLGGTHYLATVCTGQADQRWRDAMRNVMQRAPQYSDELVEAFNRGYATQQRQSPDCDANAQQTATELRARGLRISQGLAVRHTD